MASSFLTSLFDLIESGRPHKEPFEAYLAALKRLPEPGSTVATWPIATILPSFARPDHYLFLKPSITKEAARRLGFDLNYSSDPNWQTYSSALTLAETYAGILTQHGLKPRDFIDIQSFFWLVSEQFDQWLQDG